MPKDLPVKMDQSDSQDQLDRKERWDPLVSTDQRDLRVQQDHVDQTVKLDLQDHQEHLVTQESQDHQDNLEPVESQDIQVSVETQENVVSRE